MYGDLSGAYPSGCPQYAEMQQRWLHGANALARANYMLAQENMLLQTMQQNAYLAYENQMLRAANAARAQSQSLELPPHLALAQPSPKAQTLPREAAVQPPPGLELAVEEPTELTGFPKALAGKKGSKDKIARRVSYSEKISSERTFRRADSELTCSTAAPTPESSMALSTFTSQSPESSMALSVFSKTEDEDDDNDVPESTPEVAGTSTMVRNLPNDYTRSMLLELLTMEGFEGTFDFLYLPIDFRSRSGLGYAFIDFNSLEIAERFQKHFTGFKRWAVASEKICEVTWSSLQGLEAHIERYRNSPVMHESVPEEQKPVLFKDGEMICFPEPTKKIRVPRHWHRRR